jgi:hypothetical protein
MGTKSQNPIPFLSLQLPNGTWVAVELLPGQYATGKTKAQAEAGIRRKAAKPKPVADEDALDLAAIELHRHEPTMPLETLLKKFYTVEHRKQAYH